MMQMPRDLMLHPFVKKVAHALRHRCRVRRAYTPAQLARLRETEPQGTFEAGPTLLVAVSGGADSVALLRSLCALAPRRGWQLRLLVTHVNHKLRAEADADAAFVRDLLQYVPGGGDEGRPALFEHDLNPRDLQGDNLEARMRRLRYEKFEIDARRAGAEYLVTAHHADDQLETMLMRLIRGTGVAGLSAMRWRRSFLPAALPEGGRTLPRCDLIRPMLAVTHAEAVQFLRDIGQPWREDWTNEDVSRWRARLRRDVLPVLRDLRPDASHKAVELGDHLAEVHRLLREAVGRSDPKPSPSLARPAARRMNRAVLMGVLRSMLLDAGVDADRLSRRAIEPIARAIRDRRGNPRLFPLGGEVRVIVGPDAVVVERNQKPE